ncbi:hypothetical protein VAR608DRAFT_0551 [Variovorax sp. HW608]|uniref:hypothetical protein n=1 Tax=Variovorax sp. HW608 TaxID=1034889 RepID=UPI00081F7EFC|nr:hypothetical protein [Variovorax sp. HW608]SCK11194.1 hypothetical protein VAR608DRAFT_0551 [Variovorax sp. HW608]
MVSRISRINTGGGYGVDANVLRDVGALVPLRPGITPSALHARFPYMFPLEGQEHRRAYAFYRGWMPALAKACEDIDKLLGTDKRGFHWTRLREKFGSPSFGDQMEGKARVAINIHRPTEVVRHACEPVEGHAPVALAINERVLQLEVELRSCCIVCGAPSVINNDRGPWASLCPTHRAEDDGPDGSMGSVWESARADDRGANDPVP